MAYTYNPTDLITQSKAFGRYNGAVDGRTLIIDEISFQDRPYLSTSEVLVYLPLLTPEGAPTGFREGKFSVVVNSGGSYVDGILMGGVNNEYWFKDGIEDVDLVLKVTNAENTEPSSSQEFVI